MPEWPLYRPALAHFRGLGLHVASQVTDPRARRVELDVVAFSPDLSDVRVCEAKVQPSGLVAQCLDRLRYAPQVYAAHPVGQAADLAEETADGDAAVLGVLAVQRRGQGVEVLREATPTPDRIEPGKAHVLERVLRTELAEGRTGGPTA